MSDTFWTIENTWRRFGRRWPHGGCVRNFVALAALLQGFARLNPFARFACTDLVFGSHLVFGLTLMLCGVCLLVTARYRLRAVGRLAAACTAALYAVLGVALYPASAGSAFTDVLIVLTMLNEASAYE